ncbi:hypothetical protein PT2222_160166 [Paraburkholderia tropica]
MGGPRVHRLNQNASEHVFGTGEAAFLDGLHIGAHGRFDVGLTGHEVLHETRTLAGENAQHVVQHQHLSRALDARTDADGRNAQLLRDFRAERRRHRFDHHELRTGVLQRERVADQLRRARIALALHLEAAERMHRLRRKTDVRAHGHRALDQHLDGGREPFAALDLHHLRARAHQLDRVREGVFGRAEGAERQIGDDQRLGLRARHRRRVIGDVVDGDGQRGRVALEHVAERVADQHGIDARTVAQRRKARVVAGQHGDALARVAHCLEFGHGDRAAARFLQVSHGESVWKREKPERSAPLRATCP